MAAKVKDKTHVAYLITWTESERGWGQRPDGASLHLTQDDAKVYLKEYWDRMPVDVPHGYSRNDSSSGKMVAVGPVLYKELKRNKKHGIRLWQVDLNNALRDNNIKE